MQQNLKSEISISTFSIFLVFHKHKNIFRIGTIIQMYNLFAGITTKTV